MAEPESIPFLFSFHLRFPSNLYQTKNIFESKPQMLGCMIKSPNSNLTIGMPFKFLPRWWKVKPVHSQGPCGEWIFITFFLQFHWYMWRGEAAAVNVVFTEGFNKRWGVWYTIFNKESAWESPPIMFKSFFVPRVNLKKKKKKLLILWRLWYHLIVWISDWMRHHRRDPPLLLPGFLLLDVSWGGPAVPHARGGLWERILPEKVLLRLRLPLPRHRGRRLRSHRLQELRDRESVSAASPEQILWNAEQNNAGCYTARAYLLCLYVAAFLKRNLLIISASALRASLETQPKTFELLFASSGQLFNFLCHLKVADRLNTVVLGGGGGVCRYIKAFLLKDPPVTSCL